MLGSFTTKNTLIINPLQFCSINDEKVDADNSVKIRRKKTFKEYSVNDEFIYENTQIVQN